MKTLYLDIFSGISGDMFLGALIDLGVDFHAIEHGLTQLKLSGYHLHAARSHKGSIQGIKFDVHLGSHGTHHEPGDHSHHHAHAHGRSSHDDHHAHEAETHRHTHEHTHDSRPNHPQDHPHPGHNDSRDFAQIQALIHQSDLSPWVKEKAVAVFRRIAIAEGKIHGHPPEQVHFHEVGALDSIVDIVGSCIALELLGKPRVHAASVVEGCGWVDCAHGRFPVPTTATLEILGARGIPITQCDEPHELVTPTGAALLAEFVERFGPMNQLVASRIGYGLGTRDNKTRPNVLRAVLGEVEEHPAQAARDWEIDSITVIETNLDDATPEWIGHFVEQAMTAGALDVFCTPVQMKKNRPGVMVTLLCEPERADAFCELMLTQTSAFGVRRQSAQRRKLQREFARVETPHGEVTIKLGKLNGQIVHAAPEYEACRQLSQQTGRPLAEIYAAARTAWERRRS